MPEAKGKDNEIIMKISQHSIDSANEKITKIAQKVGDVGKL